MKIAVAIEKPGKFSPVSEVFGRCRYFLIQDREKDTEEILTNPFSSEIGGAGIQAAKFLIDNNVDAVITKNIGKNPFRFLVSANIKIYKYNGNNADDSLLLFCKNGLELLKRNNTDSPFTKKRNRFDWN